MTLKEKISNDPYLKISNCTDLEDLQYAISIIRDLQDQHPESKVLENMYFKFEHKRMKLIGLI